MSEEEIKKLVLEFHNTYEKLSTQYNYETRKDTKKFDFNSPNGKLMYAVIKKVVVPKIQQKENIIKEVREYCDFGIKEWTTDDGFVEKVLKDVKELLDKKNK